MLVTKYSTLTRTRLLSLLSDFELSAEGATTLYLPAGMPATEASPFLKKIAALEGATREIEKALVVSQTGAVIFWGPDHKLLVLPPFPLKEKYIATGYDIEPVKSLLTRDWMIGIILVRLGSYAVGICQGNRLIEHKTGTGLVHGRQRQGGSSSNRYRRRREEQTFHFLERVVEHAREKLEPVAKSIDYLVYGGARTTLEELRKHSKFFDQFDNRLLPPLLTIPDPRFEVLQKSVSEVWSSKVAEWREE